MNSSDFENMSSNFSFNSPSVPRSGLVFAKSRVSKRRSINRSNLKPENQAASGVNPFHHADTAYSSFPGSGLPSEGAFSAGKVGSVSIDPIGDLREGVTDEMKNLRIGGGGEPVAVASDPNAKPTFESRGGNRVGSRFSKDEVAASNLTDAMMRKLNIEGLPVEKSFTNVKAGACVNDGSKPSQAQLPLELEKLNIKGSMEFGIEKKVETPARAQNIRMDNVNLKTTSNSSSVPGNFGGVTEDVLLNEVENKLNLGGEPKCSSSKMDPLEFGFAAAPSFAFMTGENLTKKDDTNFSSRLTDAGTPFSGFTTPASKVSLVSGVGQKLEFGARRDTVSSLKLKKNGKPRQPSFVPPQPIVQEYAMSGNSSLENPEASDAYSPMDVSPYRENVVDDRSLREASVTPSESFSLDSKTAPTNSQVTGEDDPVDEDLVAASQRMEINSDDNYRELNDEPPMKNPYDDSVSATDDESFKTAPDEFDPVRDDCVISSEKNEVSCSSNFERKSNVGRAHTHYGFGSHPDETVGSNFTFSAFTSSSSSRAQIPVLKRNSKKKNSNKSGHLSYSVEIPYSSPSSILSFSTATTSPLVSPRFERGSQPLSQQRGNGSRINTGQDSNPESPSHKAVAASIAAQEACEKWRLRGNQAYASGDMSKAEECYTQGINSISRHEMSRSCLRALMLCLSNRAATRMSLGRIRDALEDCLRATEIDPNFFRVQVRAANCHLALGEIEEALQWYRKCLQAGGDILADRKIAVEASEGIQKAQKVSDCTNHCSQLLMSRTSQDAETALEIIAEALTISVYSEKLIEMKAQTLFMLLHRYQEVIQLCEQTLNSAEKNSPSIVANESPANSGSSRFTKRFQFLLWRCSLILKSYFHMGKVEEGLSSVEKLWEQFSVANCSGSSSMESSIPLVKTVRELIHLKVAGNEAFQAGKHAEAIENYTAALSYNAESRPFAAICFCNRAAAYKAMGQISDAIADCSLAIALDGNYQKAISRRAALYEKIRDYDQAAADLQRLISILNKQVDEKMTQGGYDRSLSCANELRRICLHLSEIEEEAKNGFQLDLYLILGVDSTVSILEIKKAYRKLALRHHPDKACQFLAKGDNGDETLWTGIAEEVHKDADRLFKMIGEAYAILSDSVKRARYDLDEETRKAMKRRNEASSFRTTRDEQCYPFDRSSSMRHPPREVWRTPTDSQPRLAESNRWTRYK